MSDERRRWGRNPIGPIFGALMLIWLGVVLLVAQNPETLRLDPYRVTWNNVWGFLAGGVGALLIVEALLRAVQGYRHGISWRLVWGVILVLVGMAIIYPVFGWSNIWPVALIALGVGLLLTNLLRRR
jgi:CHASE2 domain-containing sensor protein